MYRLVLVAVLAAAATVVAPSLALAQSLAVRPVVIRTYNTFGVSLSSLEGARRTASEILGAANISPTWLDCRMPRGPSARSPYRCEHTVGASEVVVRIVATPRAARALGSTFGYAHVDPQTRRGTLATIFADRISAAALRVHGDVPTLLGRAIAHELGHLLTGSISHSTAGLMRAHWSDLTLRSRLASDWLFSAAEAAQLAQPWR